MPVGSPEARKRTMILAQIVAHHDQFQNRTATPLNRLMHTQTHFQVILELPIWQPYP